MWAWFAKRRNKNTLSLLLKLPFIVALLVNKKVMGEPVLNRDLIPVDAITPNSTFYPIVSSLPEILARDITLTKKKCDKKKIGINRGRTCDIYGVMYHMKYALPDNKFRLLEMRNIKLIEDYLGIQAPTIGYVRDRGRIFVASKSIANFKMARSLIIDEHDPKKFRHEVSLKIGEVGVARLVAAQTLINDLVKLENWGFNNKGLVIIDVDQSPSLLNDYIKLAVESLCFVEHTRENEKVNHVSLALSVNNINQLKELYKAMLQQPPIHMHPSVDVSKKIFQQVLNVYIAACNDVLLQIGESWTTLDAPQYKYNALLAQSIKAIDLQKVVDSPLLPKATILSSKIQNASEQTVSMAEKGNVTQAKHTSSRYFKPKFNHDIFLPAAVACISVALLVGCAIQFAYKSYHFNCGSNKYGLFRKKSTKKRLLTPVKSQISLARMV